MFMFSSMLILIIAQSIILWLSIFFLGCTLSTFFFSLITYCFVLMDYLWLEIWSQNNKVCCCPFIHLVLCTCPWTKCNHLKSISFYKTALILHKSLTRAYSSSHQYHIWPTFFRFYIMEPSCSILDLILLACSFSYLKSLCESWVLSSMACFIIHTW
jgi:ABC-type antimicrobial peptide transport system permease subunit